MIRREFPDIFRQYQHQKEEERKSWEGAQLPDSTVDKTVLQSAGSALESPQHQS